MKLKDFIERLSSIKKELHDKKVYVHAPNGLLMEAIPKFIKKDIGCLNITKENIECIIIGY